MKLAVPSPFELGSDRAAAAGCIAGVLRRIICRSVREKRYRGGDEVGNRIGRLQTLQGKSEIAKASGVSPGIVARLMGLESSAVFPYVQQEMISRTRSASSAEAWQGPVILGEQRSGNDCTHLRKSQSFHEVPSYLRTESEEFLVLTFGNYDEGSEQNAKKMDLGAALQSMKEGKGDKKMTQKRRPGNKMSENDAERKHSDARASVSPLGKEIFDSKKGMAPNEVSGRSSSCRKKMSCTQGEMEMECSSQNSSPVSVFDLPLHADMEQPIAPDSSISVFTVSMGKSEEAESGKQISPEVEDESKKARRCVQEAFDLSDIWPLICRLGEDDLAKSCWLTKKMGKSEEAKEIGTLVGHVILDLLLHEAVFDMSK